MFIVESANDSYINESFGLPEITDWSDDSYNILESSLFFEEDMSRIIKATAVAEVMSYNEGTIESFNESVAGTVWNKIKQLWGKLKAFLKKVRDRFMAWIRKTFMSSESFFSKYKTVIKDNISKLERKNPKISVPDFPAAQKELDNLNDYSVKTKNSFYAKDGHKLGNDANDDNYIDKFNDICEEIDDIVDNFNKELDRTSEENIKDIKMADGSAITTAIVGDKPIKTYNDKHKELETDVKNCENQLKPMLKTGYVDKSDRTFDKNTQTSKPNEKPTITTKIIIYNVKIAKKALTAQHNGVIALAKAEVKAMTKAAYEAVKLQNTKEENIKEESASIDLLNKYLQRI